MPKLTALALRRMSGVTMRGGTPKTSEAVRVWMSSLWRKASSEDGVAGEVGEQAQLDLRVVGDQEGPAGCGDEGGADLAAELGADGDVLEVGVGGGEAAGGGAGWIEGGVEAAGRGMRQWGRAST